MKSSKNLVIGTVDFSKTLAIPSTNLLKKSCLWTQNSVRLKVHFSQCTEVREEILLHLKQHSNILLKLESLKIFAASKRKKEWISFEMNFDESSFIELFFLSVTPPFFLTADHFRTPKEDIIALIRFPTQMTDVAFSRKK